jgi:hypothetical protein
VLICGQHRTRKLYLCPFKDQTSLIPTVGRTMNLNEAQKQSIKALLRRMGSNQAELALEMGYQTGNRSEFLNETKNKGRSCRLVGGKLVRGVIS